MKTTTITLHQQDLQLIHHNHNDDGSVLATLEANQVCLEYQCREGYCGACRTRLLKGDVRYCRKPLALLQQGEILPCCCVPINDIELDV